MPWRQQGASRPEQATSQVRLGPGRFHLCARSARKQQLQQKHERQQQLRELACNGRSGCNQSLQLMRCTHSAMPLWEAQAWQQHAASQPAASCWKRREGGSCANSTSFSALVTSDLEYSHRDMRSRLLQGQYTQQDQQHGAVCRYAAAPDHVLLPASSQ